MRTYENNFSLRLFHPLSPSEAGIRVEFHKHINHVLSSTNVYYKFMGSLDGEIFLSVANAIKS